MLLSFKNVLVSAETTFSMTFDSIGGKEIGWQLETLVFWSFLK